MKTLSNIKKDMEFNRSLSSLIEVLKNIAVTQYKILEKKIKAFEAILFTVEGFFDMIDYSSVDHPFLVQSPRPMAVVAVTSDSGLLGGLNMQVVSRAISEIEKGKGKLVVIGDRGKSYARESKIPFVAFPGIRDEERLEQAMQLRDYLIEKLLDGTFGGLKVVYPRPVTFTVQRVETLTVVPFTPPASQAGAGVPQYVGALMESDPGDVIEYLVFLWMGQKFFEIFGLSRLAEFAARFVHLEGSHLRLKEMDQKVKLEYFRVRHELIDRNMRELFAARLLYGS